MEATARNRKVNTANTTKKNTEKTKKRTKIGQWNVRTLNQEGKLAQVIKEMERYQIDILGVSETRWKGSGEITTIDKHCFLYSGLKGEDDIHEYGVGIILSARFRNALIEWQPISERIITARVKAQNQGVTVVQCYAPTDVSETEHKEQFYSLLDKTITKINKNDAIILMGDFNAQVGSENEDLEHVIGKHGIGTQSENGELLIELCGNHNLKIGGTLFEHKKCHKVTWISPDQKSENQIDHICISNKWRNALIDVRNKRGADADTDHHLLMAKMRFEFTKHKQNCENIKRRTYDVEKARNPEIRNAFTERVRQKAGETKQTMTIEEIWQKCKSAFNEAGNETFCISRKSRAEWISHDTWEKIKERRKCKERKLQANDEETKTQAQLAYTRQSKEVKRSIKRDRQIYMEELAEKAQTAAHKGNSKELYSIIRKLAGRTNRATNAPIKGKHEEILSTVEQQLQRWREHFQEVMNMESDGIQLPEEIIGQELEINTDPPTKEELMKAIQQMKSGKSPGSDQLTADLLKIDVTLAADILHPLMEKIWIEETLPQDWKEGTVVKVPKKGDLQQCKNWRGISLLSVPSKIFYRIILNRIERTLDTGLRKEQSGFRAGHSCTDHINTIRILIDQSLEYQAPLQLLFIDYERAFDSINREYIWAVLKNRGLPSKIIKLIRAGYEGYKCRVLHKGKLSTPFEAATGVRQGCILSPLLFLIVMDNVLINALKDKKWGINWSLTGTLQDLEYADDVCLISKTTQQMQAKLNSLQEESQKAGLKINKEKTKVLNTNLTIANDLRIAGDPIEVVREFVYLGSIVSGEGGSLVDVQHRINKARASFSTMRSVWRARNISELTKLKIFNATVKPVLLYGSETWCVTNKIKTKLQSFVNRCLRHILRIWWPEIISNAELWARTGQEDINNEIKKRKYNWLGHTLRKAREEPCRAVLEWNPQGKRRPGRPRTTWRRTVAEECRKSFAQLKPIADDRQQWKEFVTTLCPARE